MGDRGEGLDMPWMMEEPMNQRSEGSFSTLRTTTDTHMPPTKDTHKALSTQPTDYPIPAIQELFEGELHKHSAC